MRVHARRALTWLLACVAGGMVVVNVFTVFGDPESRSQDAFWGMPVAPAGGLHAAGKSPLVPWFARMQFLDSNRNRKDPAAEKGGTKPFLISDQDLRKRLQPNGNYTLYHSNPKLVWPDGSNRTGDRILAQLSYRPTPGWRKDVTAANLKTVLVVSGLERDTPPGQAKFLDDACPVNSCQLTDGLEWREKADAVVFHMDPGDAFWSRPAHQVWVLYLLESPMHTAPLDGFADRINWTATYRADSTLVTPYEKFVLFPNVTSFPARASRNFAEGKTLKVAWFVSNCGARNARSEYVEKLMSYIQVDVFGSCGNMTCSRVNQDMCYDMLKRDYKFYLSFENSNCIHYITEKLYWNALWNDVVPIVMGARKEDYIQVVPPGSFIHVEDFRSAKELADYLHKLDQNDDLYNNYFRWKGTGEFINTKFWCRLCAMLHDHHVTWYDDVEHWWRGNGTCTTDRWDDQRHLVNNWQDFIEPAMGTYD